MLHDHPDAGVGFKERRACCLQRDLNAFDRSRAGVSRREAALHPLPPGGGRPDIPIAPR